MPRQRKRKVHKVIDPPAPKWPPPIEYAPDGLPTATGGPWAEWWEVMRRVREEGAHPSDEHLRRLREQDGVPDYAETYVAARDAGALPGSKTATEMDGWQGAGVFTAEQASALLDLRHLTNALDDYRPSESGPKHSNEWRSTINIDCLVPLDDDDEPVPVRVTLKRAKKPGSRWRIRDPKQQARKIVAARYGVSEETLLDWEQRFRASDAWLGEWL